MTMLISLVVVPFAKLDIQHAFEWYESKQYDLGKRFKVQVVKAIDILLDSRKDYGSIYMGLSRVFVKKFPYVVYFRKDSKRNRIVIYAVLHEKQNREILKKRI